MRPGQKAWLLVCLSAWTGKFTHRGHEYRTSLNVCVRIFLSRSLSGMSVSQPLRHNVCSHKVVKVNGVKNVQGVPRPNGGSAVRRLMLWPLLLSSRTTWINWSVVKQRKRNYETTWIIGSCSYLCAPARGDHFSWRLLRLEYDH